MRHFITVGLLTVAGLLGWTIPTQAQVFVRAPFVRVYVGGPYGPGVGVRAPFVNLWVPNTRIPPSVMYVPPPPPGTVQAPAAKLAPPAEEAPSPRSTKQNPLTLDQFAKSFQPRPGNYDVTLINPVTKTPTAVRFTLPEGTPRRFDVWQDRVTFNYGRRHFVRIDFDEDGAIVTSR
jgi:hypothetical protein